MLTNPQSFIIYYFSIVLGLIAFYSYYKLSTRVDEFMQDLKKWVKSLLKSDATEEDVQERQMIQK